ncbi:MAG TPA: NAD-dependent epimerase/dehydratase family protein, partial [Thermoanaerobaculia bacterium]
GPRAQMRHSRYGVVNWFVRLTLDGSVIPVFGDGTILRDFLYVDDCVEAILLAAGSDAAFGEVLNVGGGEPTTFRAVAETLSSLTGARWEFAPFSPERKAQEPGDFVSDITKIGRLLGWRPEDVIDLSREVEDEVLPGNERVHRVHVADVADVQAHAAGLRSR